MAVRSAAAAVLAAVLLLVLTQVPLVPVVVRQLVRGFDWDRGAFDVSPRPTAEGTLDLDAERFSPR